MKQKGPEGLTRQGNYAGAISRLVAIACDVGIAWGALLLILAGINVAVSLIIGHSIHWMQYRWVGIIIVVLWYPLYFAYQWSLSGKTLGMALFGLRVVTAEGAAITGRQAILRTLTLPFAIALFGLGLFGIVLRTDHRGWADRVAKTCVVYDWDARAARMRWLATRHDAAVADLPASKG
jgi:uncharacterized RDD family membrane protein YckC